MGQAGVFPAIFLKLVAFFETSKATRLFIIFFLAVREGDLEPLLAHRCRVLPNAAQIWVGTSQLGTHPGLPVSILGLWV